MLRADCQRIDLSSFSILKAATGLVIRQAGGKSFEVVSLKPLGIGSSYLLGTLVGTVGMLLHVIVTLAFKILPELISQKRQSVRS